MPGIERYGEISSASNCTDYQSRRLNIRFRCAQTCLVHCLAWCFMRHPIQCTHCRVKQSNVPGLHLRGCSSLEHVLSRNQTCMLDAKLSFCCAQAKCS